jgi:hypothetical protein
VWFILPIDLFQWRGRGNRDTDKRGRCDIVRKWRGSNKLSDGGRNIRGRGLDVSGAGAAGHHGQSLLHLR